METGPVTNAYNDLLVALGVRSAPAPIEPGFPAPLAIPSNTEAPLRISVDQSSKSGQVYTRVNASIPSQFSYPSADLLSGVAESTEVRYGTVSTLGRPQDFKTFVGVGSREVSMSIRLHAHGGDYDNEIRYPALFIESLKFPVVDGGISYPPPPVFVSMGRVIYMRAVVTSANIAWGPTWTNDGGVLTPDCATVTVGFTQVDTFDKLDDYRFRFDPSRIGKYT